MSSYDGGPAFPRNSHLKSYGDASEKNTFADEYNDGMSLRDYFAAAALSGFMATFQAHDNPVEKTIASLCYRLADAMLEAKVSP